MVERYKEELEAVDEQMQAELDALQDKHSEMQGEIREIAINPLKKDIVVEFFLVWRGSPPSTLIKPGTAS